MLPTWSTVLTAFVDAKDVEAPSSQKYDHGD
jgi:hypothetical protein